MEKPNNQNNSFSRSHTIGTRNINIKTIKNIFINLPITIFSFKPLSLLLFKILIIFFYTFACWIITTYHTSRYTFHVMFAIFTFFHNYISFTFILFLQCKCTTFFPYNKIFHVKKMLKRKAFFDKTTKNITALIFGAINFNEIIFYTTKAQKNFLLTKFSCIKITTVFHVN